MYSFCILFLGCAGVVVAGVVGMVIINRKETLEFVNKLPRLVEGSRQRLLRQINRLEKKKQNKISNYFG